MYEELTPSEIESKKNNMNENNKKVDAKENNKKENAKENSKENAKEDLVEQKKDNYTINQSNYIEHSVFIENCNAKWLDYEREDTLQNINLKVRPGELIAIVGQVGSGKSSLLNVILKELRLQEGSIQVCWYPSSKFIILNIEEREI